MRINIDHIDRSGASLTLPERNLGRIEKARRGSTFRFNGKEWDEETGNFYYGARYYDPKISVWLSVDPLAHKYPNISPYTFVANNPIMFVDPDGRHIDLAILDENDKNYNAENAQAFREFARTKEGQAFLAKYASEGQEIEGITYESGEYDKQGIDLSYTSSDYAEMAELNRPLGSTKYTKGENGRHLFTISLNSNYKGEETSSSKILFDKAKTLVHESFIHVDYFIEDLNDNGKQDYSNIPRDTKLAAGYKKEYHHYHELNRANNGQTSFSTNGFNALKAINKSLKSGFSGTQIWTRMYSIGPRR